MYGRFPPYDSDNMRLGKNRTRGAGGWSLPD